ncbi:hypothetical protein CALCODRAFT_493579 [Calocera cornea HHB12733]|uniref:CNH domain-containing protein n=1 Tax=Calocera cornea HHB12733 TaxID=1353952 RepID=A0A165HL58_9BASI|nr:hypothetical protein CALCODRAFT_493579 [Calocera cornea HHB12733]
MEITWLVILVVALGPSLPPPQHFKRAPTGMPPYPVTNLVVGDPYAVLAAGPWLQLLHASSGELLAEEDTTLPIRVLAVDESFEHIVTTADNKKLVVRQREGLKVLSTRCAHPPPPPIQGLCS